jgi:oxygen-independent coproporphyrinogen III oxidase
MSATIAAEPRAVGQIEAPAAPDAPFGIYVHVPFCAHVCPYCDFNTYAGQAERIPAYVEALERETARWTSRFVGRSAGSLFLGGGTPSLLTPGQIGAILRACREAFLVADDAEITIETNPNDLTADYCAALLEMGVNRISIGAQTLDRRGLRVLGRRHEAAQIASAVADARLAGFDNLSLDFIFGWPGQTLAGWRDELARLLAGDVGGSPPDHLSLYNLIVEPGTPMADAVHRGILAPLGDDDAADLYESAVEILAAAGWVHYEIANWSATPSRYSRHNAVYWQNGDYAGLGAGAHGHVAGERTMNHPSPQRYIALIQAGESPLSNTERIDGETAMAETMMLGLRLLRDGVSAPAFLRRHGVALRDRYGGQLDRLASLGLIESVSSRIRLTARGVLVANSVCSEFLSS